MLHPRQHITDLAEICRRKGVARVIISPGSRSAPLIKSFVEIFGDLCISIVDERSAAYFALGTTLYLQKPVVLICTSGTAVLNYSPALAEAYYQRIPLLAITADRPREWIDQQDNQTLRQTGIFRNYIKESYDLPQVIVSEDDLWYAHRVVNEAINVCISRDQGPVHLNVPLTEPLYGELPQPSENIRLIQQVEPEVTVSLPDELVREWENATKIMIIHGQDIPGSEVASLLPHLAADGRIIIMAENIANIPGRNILSNSNFVLSTSRGSNPDYPNLILHSGGQVVSKALTAFLRKAPRINCWRIGTEKGIIDTFKQVTHRISLPPATVYRTLAGLNNGTSSSTYGSKWHSMAKKANALAEERVSQVPFSDLAVFNHVLRQIPEGTVIVLGNSSIIRYAQIFPASDKLSYYANRGVSGIDGCLSTAAGIAAASKKLTLVITGDLGFVYDSNALWNRELPANLRILVINNGGGAIFHIIKGPVEQPGFKKFIEAHHPVIIHKLAAAFGLDHYLATDDSDLKKQWNEFMQERTRAALFEVITDAAISASGFRQMMSSLG